MKRLASCALLALGLWGCGPKEVNYSLAIITQSCVSSADPFQGVDFLRIQVTGENMPALTVVAAAASHQAKLPEIPAGVGRVIEVRAYHGDPRSGGSVVSMGRSLPFDVPGVVSEALKKSPLKVNVILRKVDTFAPIASAADPAHCSGLNVPRAGHSATLLKSGKVLVAGGFNMKGDKKTAMADAQLFDPSSGEFVPVKGEGARDLSPRAHHTALMLQNGQVLFWGGEAYADGEVNPVPSVIIYDEDSGGYSNPVSATGRSHHRTALDENGKVLTVGGITRKGGSLGPADRVDWFDPATNMVREIPGLYLSVLEPTVMAMKKGKFVAVVGGTDGKQLRNEILYFEFKNQSFGQLAVVGDARLATPRRAAGAAVIRDGSELLVLGGYSDPALTRPLATSEVVSGGSGGTAVVGSGPSIRAARGDLCAVSLLDGTVLAMGGRTSDILDGGAADGGFQTRSDSTAVLLKPHSTGVSTIPVANLPQARYGHTCTTLQDGSVLVTGGIKEQDDGTVSILQDAYIYTPAPAD